MVKKWNSYKKIALMLVIGFSINRLHASEESEKLKYFVKKSSPESELLKKYKEYKGISGRTLTQKDIKEALDEYDELIKQIKSANIDEHIAKLIAKSPSWKEIKDIINDGKSELERIVSELRKTPAAINQEELKEHLEKFYAAVMNLTYHIGFALGQLTLMQELGKTG